MASKYPHVFEPFEIRGVLYKNRLEQAPPGCFFAGDERGFVTDKFVEYFRQYARGGVAVCSVGNCSIDITESSDEDGVYDITLTGLSATATLTPVAGVDLSLLAARMGVAANQLRGMSLPRQDLVVTGRDTGSLAVTLYNAAMLTAPLTYGPTSRKVDELSFRGLPCPNLSTGGYNYHGRKELIPVQSLEKMVEVLETLVTHSFVME